MSDQATPKPSSKLGFSPLCVIIVLVVAWIGVAAAVITLIVFGSMNLATKSHRADNIAIYNQMALNWTESQAVFSKYFFQVTTDFTPNMNVSVDNTVSIVYLP